ncbi:MAG: DNRLRE domain-containing protein [Sedimentisphaerales bacterium]|nr:DNRLRE domain-containing protein [Sedimentisphaerales bacterium]
MCAFKILSRGFLIALLIGSLAGAQPTTLTPTDDSFVDEWAPTTIYGSQTLMIVRSIHLSGYELDSLLRFDLSPFAAGTVVQSARLHMYYYHYNNYNPTGQSLEAHRIQQPWSESIVKWTNRPSYDPASSAAAAVPAKYDWMHWDLTADVQAIIDGAIDNNGWEIINPESVGNAMIYFYAKESAQSQCRPYLEVVTQQANCGDWGYPAGDLNRDCVVNLADLAILARHWLTCSRPGDPDCDRGQDAIIGVGMAFDPANETEPASILYLYHPGNEGVLEPNDIIMEYREHPIENGRQLFELIQILPDVEPGEIVPITVLRQNNMIAVSPAADVIAAGPVSIYQECGYKRCKEIDTTDGKTCRCEGASTMQCYSRIVTSPPYIEMETHDYKYHEIWSECFNKKLDGTTTNHCLHADPSVIVGK